MSPSPRERQIERVRTAVPCVACGDPSSPLGDHECGLWTLLAFEREKPSMFEVLRSAMDACMAQNGRVDLIAVGTDSQARGVILTFPYVDLSSYSQAATQRKWQLLIHPDDWQEIVDDRWPGTPGTSAAAGAITLWGIPVVVT